MIRYFLFLVLLIPIKINATTATSWVVDLTSMSIGAGNTLDTTITDTNPGDIFQAIVITSCSANAGAYISVGDSSQTVVGNSGLTSTFTVVSTYGTSTYCPAMGTYEYGIRLSSAATFRNIGGALATFLIKNENGLDNR